MSGTSTYLSGTLYDAAGRVTQRNLGNGLTQEYTYNSWTNDGGRLANLTTGTLQDLSYSYDDNGNIESIVDALNGPQTQSFTYDTLNRLTSATATGGQNGLYNESGTNGYTYDATTGNLASKAGVSYTYNTNHPHAVASLSNGNEYDYDANGNMTSREVNNEAFTFSYDAENRMVGVTGNGMSASFTYDADGKRVQQVIDNVTTKFIGSHYEIDGTTVIKYYLAGAARVAMRTGTDAPKYFLQDHLGSTNITTDSSGNQEAEMMYTAWGEVRHESTNPPTPTNYTYTGQYSNSDFGLMYYNARWYDPALGRFAQADSIVPGAGNPQAYDRYAYVLNNPVNGTDPSGHLPCSILIDGEYCYRPINNFELPYKNVGSQFDFPVTDGLSNGQCGTFATAAAFLASDPQNRTMEEFLQYLLENNYKTNWLSASEILTLINNLGWESIREYMGGGKDNILRTLIRYMAQGYYPMLYTWSDSSGNLLTNTDQIMQLKDPLISNSSFIGGSRHWVLVTKITKSLTTNQATVTIYNPGTGKIEQYSWDFLYRNMGITYQIVFGGGVVSTTNSWLSIFFRQ